MATNLYRKSGKRLFDLALTIPAILLLSPVIAIVAIATFRDMGTPVIFRQRRPGLKGHPFMMYKFRTMTLERDDQGSFRPDEDRLTALGRFLRSSSLDELPGLWNVIRGDMSLVGPRPLLMRYLERYTPEQMRRHDILPGVTGWAQVNGRNAITWEEKFALDVWYVENVSFLLDCKILFITLLRVIRRRHVSHPGEATMREFSG